jgi:hypothetical protein
MRDDKHWGVLRPVQVRNFCEPTTTRIAGGLDFAAIGGKRQGREEPQSLRVESGAKHPVENPIKFRIWPGRGSALETTLKQEIVQPLKKLDPVCADWTSTVNYEEIYAQLNHILIIIKFSYFNDDASE